MLEAARRKTRGVAVNDQQEDAISVAESILELPESVELS
jgi:hypothetical protein